MFKSSARGLGGEKRACEFPNFRSAAQKARPERQTADTAHAADAHSHGGSGHLGRSAIGIAHLVLCLTAGGRQYQFEPLSRGRSAGTYGQAVASRVERQLQKLRRRAYISADVSFEGTAVCRRENRGGQQ